MGDIKEKAEGAATPPADDHVAPASETSAGGNIGEARSSANGSSVEFLERFHDRDLWPLTSIAADGGKIEAHSFDSAKSAGDWIGFKCGKVNVYFNPATPRDRIVKKCSKADIASTRWLWADADPIKLTPERAAELGEEGCRAYYATERAEILAAIDRLPIKPTVVGDSGNGYQVFYRLRVAMPCNTADEIEEVEARNRWLAAQFGSRSDHCHSVDHVMRLPATLNLPSAKKRSAGITSTSRASVDIQRTDWTREYDAAEFGKAAAIAAAASAQREIVIPDELPIVPNLEEIAALVGPRCDSLRHLIVKGHRPNFQPAYKSRSDALFAAVTGMMRAGVEPAMVCAIILDERFAISASVRDKGRDARQYALRQIERAIAKGATKDSAKAAPGHFELDQEGNIIATSQENIRLAIDKLGVKLRYDMFADYMPIEGLDGFEVFNDAASNRLWLDIDSRFHFRPAFDLFYRVVTDAARRNSFHPVRDYLDEVQSAWDGEPRLNTWLIRHGGVVDARYAQAVSALGLIAAVRRIRKPGVKFDEMVVLESPAQGTNKSSALAALCPRPEWFSDDLPLNCDSQEVIERTAGKWIIEAAELSGMKHITSIERLKSFMSRCRDRARLAWGRVTEDRPRSFVVFGTTNESKYLKDTTGNRRFWPLAVVLLDIAAIVAERDQLWGEAATREANGESIRLDKSLWGAAGVEQEERRADDPWEDKLRTLLDGVVGKMKVDDAFKAIGKFKVGERTQNDQERLGAAMRMLGWQHARLHFDGPKVGCYWKGNEHERHEQVRLVEELDDTNRGTGVWKIDLF